MKFPVFVDINQVKDLELERISRSLRIHLTRLLAARARIHDDNIHDDNIQKMYWINKSFQISGDTTYSLDIDTPDVYYRNLQTVWIDNNFCTIFLRLNTIQCIELICELIHCEMAEVEEINELLDRDNLSFSIAMLYKGKYYKEPYIKLKQYVPEDSDIEDSDISEHPNVRFLFHRMETLLDNDDYPGVFHTAGSIIETMAKDILGDSSTKPFKSLKASYRKGSNLREPMLDWLDQVYLMRNKEPLAGHGSTQIPNISKEEAVICVELTKSFVRIEYSLRGENSKIELPKKGENENNV